MEENESNDENDDDGDDSGYIRRAIEESASTSSSSQTLTPEQMKALLKTMEKVPKLKKFERSTVKRFRFGGTFSVADNNGEAYDQRVLKKEFHRYLRMARSDQEMAVGLGLLMVREFLKSSECLKLYPDFPQSTPISAHRQLRADCIQQYSEEHPDERDSDMFVKAVQGANERWNAMSAEEKKTAEKEFKEGVRKQYDDQIRTFFDSHPELRDFKQEYLKRETAKEKARTLKATPKFVPRTAFDMFVEAKSVEYAKRYELQGDELKAKMERKFQKLSDSKKTKYSDQAEEWNKTNKRPRGRPKKVDSRENLALLKQMEDLENAKQKILTAENAVESNLDPKELGVLASKLVNLMRASVPNVDTTDPGYATLDTTGHDSDEPKKKKKKEHVQDFRDTLKEFGLHL